MATITNSELVESTPRTGYKRNLYRYTLSDGTVHMERGWIPDATDSATDMAARGAALLSALEQAEINGLLGAA